MSETNAGNVLVDHEARRKALDITRSFIVEAPAGSGKTTLLTQRFLRLLANAESPESIVAITFSRKAAEEMRARIVGALRAVKEATHELDAVTAEWATAAAKNAAERQWGLETNPRRLRILTIDALAQLIVRRHPLLAGGVSGQQVAEDAASLYALAARNTIEEVGAGSEWSQAVQAIVGHLDNNWPRLERLLSTMLANRDQWLMPVASNPQRHAIERSLSQIVARKLATVAPLLSAQEAKSLIEIGNFCGANLAAADSQSNITTLANLNAPPSADPNNLANNLANSLADWRGLSELLLTTTERSPRKRFTKNEGFIAKDSESTRLKKVLVDLLADCDPALLAGLKEIADLPDPIFSDDSWQKLQALFTVLKLAAAHLGLVFQQAGTVDFTEITLSAINALGSDEVPSEASLLLDYQIEHLLIDEFQDTSVAQHQLVARLIGGWSAEQNRSLFLVGDPMQSIYRFRQADVSRFTETFAEQRFQQVPLEALRLQANFRSDPVVIDWINQALQEMAREENGFPPTATLSAVRPAQHGSEVQVHGLSKEDSSGACVVDLVKQIRTELAADAKSPSIAVLVRNRSHLSDITAQLREANIPLLATDIDNLLEQPIIADLLALTRALIHPADTTAWLALLRAPWLGLSLVELSHLVMRANGAVIPDALPAAENLGPLSAQSRQRLQLFNAAVLAALNYVGRMPIATIVANTWHALRGAEMAQQEHAYHYAERFLKLLNDFEQREGLVTAPALEQFLAKRFVSPVADGGDAVQVMTIHKAKGLEFDAVILPGLNRGTRADDNPLLRWQADGEDELLMSLLPARGRADQLYTYLRGKDKEASLAESYRLLYVALTRAKTQLHLVCETLDENSRPYKGSLQQLLWPAVASALTGDSVGEHKQAEEPSAPLAGRQPLLRRVQALPLPARRLEQVIEPNPMEELEFLWASPNAKYIGTATHQVLQLIGQLGLEQFRPLWRDSAAKLIERRLLAIGIDAAHLTAASQKVAQAVDQLLSSERGCWLFDTAHVEAHSELPLTALVGEQSINVVLDRTFVSSDGVRWIVDFKTSEHLEADLESFLDIQEQRYSPQLNRYAEVLNAIDSRTTKLGLYFPLHDAWREWDYQQTQIP